MYSKFKVFSLIFIIVSCSFVKNSFCGTWESIKGEHFIIEYAQGVELSFAKKVLKQAEIFYNKIASHLGFARYDDYWTWDNRTKIIIYFDKDSFIKETGRPDWAIGFAVHDKRFFETRTIVTYQRDVGFLHGVLPHEIGHLILRDFIGKDKQIPTWFDEGVAQLYEANKRSEANKVMRFMVARNIYIPLNGLMTVILSKKDTNENIAIFYSESVSLVDFLIKKYGNKKFLQLCKELRDGPSLEAALEDVYSSNFDSLDGFEKKWVSSLKEK